MILLVQNWTLMISSVLHLHHEQYFASVEGPIVVEQDTMADAHTYEEGNSVDSDHLQIQHMKM